LKSRNETPDAKRRAASRATSLSRFSIGEQLAARRLILLSASVVSFFSVARSSSRVFCKALAQSGETIEMEHRNIGTSEQRNKKVRQDGRGQDSNLLRQGIYVRHVTAASIQGLSQRCQGLHNETFLSYGFSHLERTAPLVHQTL
jgi:hypothetical protein